AGLEFSIIETSSGTLEGVFQSLEKHVELNLISKPELMVANTMPAIIKAGGQVPFQDVSYSGTTPTLKVAWRDVGVNLNLTPTIMPNDYVQLNITQMEVSDTARIDNIRGVDLPVFSSRSQAGVVFVPDGTTLVIGGLSSRMVRQSERRVPVLGRLPLIGIPFRSRKSDAEVTSLLIFVSPTVVDMRAPTPQAKSALAFWRERGSDWAHAQRIDREVDACNPVIDSPEYKHLHFNKSSISTEISTEMSTEIENAHLNLYSIPHGEIGRANFSHTF
ncbi:MAG TPA: type II and III secretion system protein, partial [Candidatus Hydrogenedentes bacterium]|nr:type II and III secretion system protein [Candidatus Hydrogenedentota bacterium]